MRTCWRAAPRSGSLLVAVCTRVCVSAARSSEQAGLDEPSGHSRGDALPMTVPLTQGTIFQVHDCAQRLHPRHRALHGARQRRARFVGDPTHCRGAMSARRGPACALCPARQRKRSRSVRGKGRAAVSWSPHRPALQGLPHTRAAARPSPAH